MYINKILIFNIFFIIIFIKSNAQEKFNWEKVADMPALGQHSNLGFAGVFAGVNNDKLIIAGGANFPDEPAWIEGSKWWTNEIFVLDKRNEEYTWMDTVFHLPEPLAYGVSVPIDQGILCIGGNNQNGASSGVYLLYWNEESNKIEVEQWPDLPDNFITDAGAKVGEQIMIHGIQNGENKLLSFDLNERKWNELPGCPGPARSLTVATAQSNGEVDCLYLFSGRFQKNDSLEIFKDAWYYSPLNNTWNSIGEIKTNNSSALSVMAATTIPVGAHHILIIGGDRGPAEFYEKFDLERQRARAKDEPTYNLLTAEIKNKFDEIPPFSDDLLLFHTITQTFTKAGKFPVPAPVTSKALVWGDDMWIISGEAKPGVRTPVIWRGNIPSQRVSFGFLNYLVIGLYFGVLLFIGYYFSKRQESTNDYFKGGQRIPWWAAGLSLFGTSLSAITFMAIPAKTYATNWSYFFFQMTPLLAAPLIVLLFIPFFRRLDVTTAYEYLEKRFNLLTRLLGSVSFIIFQLGRVGIVLYLPSIAINMVTNIDITLCILLMGIVSITYTLVGGIEAVIWTDVMQVLVLMGGAFLTLILIFINVENGIAGIYEQALQSEKFEIFNFAFDFRNPTFWVVILGGFFANLISSGSDQSMVQRYLTTRDESGAKRSAWTFAFLAIPATLIFFGLGTALFSYYSQYPDDLDPGMIISDAIFPWYIITKLPQGISGLLIAGIFSAAMSSLSSSINSASTAFTTDFFDRFRKKKSNSLPMARWATLVFGILGTAFAIMMASWDIKSLWDQFQLYIGLFAGGLGGLFLLGITTKKANGVGAVIGLILSGFVQYYLTSATKMNVLLFTMTGVVSCYFLSYIFSLFFQQFNKDIDGLTIQTIK